LSVYKSPFNLPRKSVFEITLCRVVTPEFRSCQHYFIDYFSYFRLPVAKKIPLSEGLFDYTLFFLSFLQYGNLQPPSVVAFLNPIALKNGSFLGAIKYLQC
jgi:hypothetical protein